MDIESQQSIINCKNYFPNVTTLTFNEQFSITRSTITINLNHIIPLKQLTKLILVCHHFSFKKMIDLLYFTPYLHTLIFESMPFYKDDYISIEKSDIFQLVSNTNNIKNVIFKDRCTLEKLRLLVTLCPRIQHLSISIRMTTSPLIIRFLLDKTNQNTRHLYSLCFSRVYNNKWLEKLDILLKYEILLDDYLLKFVNSKLYLWW